MKLNRVFSTRLMVLAAVLFCMSCGGGGGRDGGGGGSSPISPAYKLDWVNFSPYVEGQDPNAGSIVSEQQIRDRLRILTPYTKGIRTFGSTRGLEHAARIAKSEFNYRTAVGAWLGTDPTANVTEMTNLIAAAKSGYVDIAIVGNEVLLRNDLSENELIGYIEQFRSQVPTVPVTSADTYNVLLAPPGLIAACDVVFVNISPFWEGKSVDSAPAYLHAYYLQMLSAAGGKPVYVSEAGWPSNGNTVGSAVPNPDNAAQHFLNAVSWARQETVNLIYFEAFDESWKALYEGPQGAHWGIFTRDGTLKPGMQRVFDDEMAGNNWTCAAPVGGDGTPEIVFVSAPPVGSENDLYGQVRHVIPTNYRVAVYIKVGGGWWTKPTFAAPLTPIDCGGTWVTDITTGGSDSLATEIAAYLVPAGYNPPAASGGALPEAELNANSAARVRITR
jgi:exo-beta-1,3-glucanase (GH17 family)